MTWPVSASTPFATTCRLGNVAVCPFGAGSLALATSMVISS